MGKSGPGMGIGSSSGIAWMSLNGVRLLDVSLEDGGTDPPMLGGTDPPCMPGDIPPGEGPDPSCDTGVPVKGGITVV